MGAIGFPETWNYNGFLGGARDIELAPGVFDENARDVFCRGHCHSLALALYELVPGSELIGVWVDSDPDHVCVKLPDGTLLDGNGVSTEEEMEERYGAHYIGWVDEDGIAEYEEMGHFRRARVEDAVPFARALIEREGVGEMALAA